MSGIFGAVKRRIKGFIQEQLNTNTMLLAKLNIERIQKLDNACPIQAAEFQVFSQGGEDGILQYLISQLHLPNKTFIEFGVESYLESNTRFLLENNNWKGLVLDGTDENIQLIKEAKSSYARHDLTAVSAFVTRENVNQLFKSAEFSGDIGLLSIDVDGNDYWIWEAIDMVSPRIVICEYNSVFGSKATITVPYDSKFERSKAHYSYLYFGASLGALCFLAEKKGYDFVGSNSMGNNAFFIRKDLDHSFKKLTVQEGYVESKHRMDSRDSTGKLSRVGGSKRLKIIQALPAINVSTGLIGTVVEFI